MRRILLIDNDQEERDPLAKVITEDSHIVQTVGEVDSALHRLKAWKPHLILVNSDSPNLGGHEIISRIRTTSPDDYTAIIVISSVADLASLTLWLEAGADDCLVRPFRPIDLIARVRANLHLKEVQDILKRATHRIEDLSSIDDLTGLMNMRVIYRRGDEEIIRSRRAQKPISALLLNIDGFSNVNQTYGFMAGSRVLQEVASRIKQCLGSMDLAARVGADEFFVLLMNTDLGSAETMAERLKDSIAFMPFKNEKHSVTLTACLGVGGLTPELSRYKMSDLLHITTEALKSAKTMGENRIEVYSFT